MRPVCTVVVDGLPSGSSAASSPGPVSVSDMSLLHALGPVQTWLGQELEKCGIDAMIYTRYVLSLLLHDSYDYDLQEQVLPCLMRFMTVRDCVHRLLVPWHSAPLAPGAAATAVGHARLTCLGAPTGWVPAHPSAGLCSLHLPFSVLGLFCLTLGPLWLVRARGPVVSSAAPGGASLCPLGAPHIGTRCFRFRV